MWGSHKCMRLRAFSGMGWVLLLPLSLVGLPMLRWREGREVWRGKGEGGRTNKGTNAMRTQDAQRICSKISQYQTRQQKTEKPYFCLGMGKLTFLRSPARGRCSTQVGTFSILLHCKYVNSTQTRNERSWGVGERPFYICKWVPLIRAGHHISHSSDPSTFHSDLKIACITKAYLLCLSQNILL